MTVLTSHPKPAWLNVFCSSRQRASGRNRLINAIVYWNTLYLEPASAELNREGVATPPDVIEYIARSDGSPIARL